MCGRADLRAAHCNRNPAANGDSRPHVYRYANPYAYAHSVFYQHATTHRDADADSLGDCDKRAIADQAADRHADGFPALCAAHSA